MATLILNVAYRAAVGVAAATVLLLLWMNAAVGTEDDNSGGLIFLGVLVVGIGAIAARFQPQGMARALCGSTRSGVGRCDRDDRVGAGMSSS